MPQEYIYPKKFQQGVNFEQEVQFNEPPHSLKDATDPDHLVRLSQVNGIIGGNISIDTVAFVADGSHAIENGKVLMFIEVIPAADIVLRIGTAAGLDDISPDTDITAADGSTVTLFLRGNKTIYISGITANTTIKFYKV
jgi:hypothetical protein